MIMRAALILFFLASHGLNAQSPTTGKTSEPGAATVTFQFDWPAFTPQQYSLTVKSDGSTHYSSSSPQPVKGQEEASDEDYQLDFILSPATRDSIFKLAAQAGYFNGDFEFHKHAVAHTGKKTLAYSDGSRSYQTTFNYSENAAVDRLAHIFMGISTTLQHGRKLQFLRRFDKLGLEAALKSAEQDAESDDLVELQLIAPLLESIAGDKSILHIARQRAERLLSKSRAPSH